MTATGRLVETVTPREEHRDTNTVTFKFEFFLLFKLANLIRC